MKKGTVDSQFSFNEDFKGLVRSQKGYLDRKYGPKDFKSPEKKKKEKMPVRKVSDDSLLVGSGEEEEEEGLIPEDKLLPVKEKDAPDMRKLVEELKPKRAKEECLCLWEVMATDYEMSSEKLFEQVWAMVTEDTPELFRMKVTYKKWKDEYDDAVVCEGFVDKVNKGVRKHGYMRKVEKNGEIIEATYRNGEQHGLFRQLMLDNQLLIMLFNDGALLSQLLIQGSGKDFKIVHKEDKRSHLKKLGITKPLLQNWMDKAEMKFVLAEAKREEAARLKEE